MYMRAQTYIYVHTHVDLHIIRVEHGLAFSRFKDCFCVIYNVICIKQLLIATYSFVYISEWVLKIPIIVLMGVSTTLDAPRNILPSNVLQHLCPSKFILGSPAERMDAVVEAVLVKQCSGFSVGHKVAVFLRNYFLNQDGTLTSFIRALKVGSACLLSLLSLSLSCQHG